MCFTKYGRPMVDIGLTDLIGHNRIHGDLWARAEDSGCEGCYCEVARWDKENRRWSRYAFEKYFGDEHHTGWQLANAAAGAINGGREDDLVLIHSMPNYGEKEPCLSCS